MLVYVTFYTYSVWDCKRNENIFKIGHCCTIHVVQYFSFFILCPTALFDLGSRGLRLFRAIVF